MRGRGLWPSTNPDYSWAGKAGNVYHCFVRSSAVHNGRALLALQQAVAHRRG
jgi:hypothetical protein